MSLDRRLVSALQQRTFKPREDDVFVVTFPKSGTTWVQMILYQLMTEGSMSLPHIRCFSPFYEVDAAECGKDYEAMPSPRVFKTHLSFERVYNPVSKFIYVARNGMDVARSYHYHHQAYNGFRGEFDEFFEAYLNGRIDGQSWFRHVAGWVSQNRANILFLKYEDLLADLEGGIRKIAAFCGYAPDAATLERIVSRSRFDFMKTHQDKFDLALGSLYAKGMVLGQFIREGKKGRGVHQLDEHQRKAYLQHFTRYLEGCGLEAYKPK